MTTVAGIRWIFQGLALLEPLRPRWETEESRLFKLIQQELRFQKSSRNPRKLKEEQMMDPATRELIGQLNVIFGIGALIFVAVMLLAMLNELFVMIEQSVLIQPRMARLAPQCFNMTDNRMNE